MPSIVKATPRMAAGSMQLVSYDFEIQADNTLAISARFVCLPAFADANMSLLRNGAPAPAALMASGELVRLMQSVQARDTPTVRAASAQTSYGLTTISVTLGVEVPPAIRQPAESVVSGGGSLIEGTEQTGGATAQTQESAKANYEITTSVDLKSLSGSVLFIANTSSVSFSFSYYAETITTEGNAVARSPNVGSPFAVRSGSSDFRQWISPFVVNTLRTYRNSLGVMKEQRTAAAIYIQSTFEI